MNISFTCGVSESLAFEYRARRLAAVGFPYRACVTALQRCHGNEELALRQVEREHLQLDMAGDGPDTADMHNAVLDDECAALESIYSEQCSHIMTEHAHVVTLRVADMTSSLPGDFTVEFHIPHGIAYPDQVPSVIVIHAKLQAFLK